MEGNQSVARRVLIPLSAGKGWRHSPPGYGSIIREQREHIHYSLFIKKSGDAGFFREA
jgi:hypothetical protein